MAKSFELELIEEEAIADVQAMVLRILDAKNISRSELAKRMEVSPARISQLLGDEPENLSVRKAAALFHALGETLKFTCDEIERLDRLAEERNIAAREKFAFGRTLRSWRIANGNEACLTQDQGLAA